MADKIIWAIENPVEMKALAITARKEAESRFSIEKITRMHEELYNEVVSNYSNINN